MDDDIRQRRLQRLAALERASPSPGPQNTAPQPPVPAPGSEAQPEPREAPRGPPEEAPQPKAPKAEPQISPKPAQAAQRPAAQPKTQATKPAGPTVAGVFGLKNGAAAPAWAEIESDPHGFLWDMIAEQKRPLMYLIGVFSRLDAVESPQLAEQLRETVVTLAFVSASADEEEDVYEDLATALLDASMMGQLPPLFVQRFLAFAATDSDVFPALVGDTLNLVEQLELGDARTMAMFRLFEYVLSNPEALELALQLPAPEGDRHKFTPKQIDSTFLGAVMGLGISAGGLEQLHTERMVLDSALPEVVERAKQAEPISGLLERAQFDLVNKLVRQGERPRRLVLQWFRAVLNSNHGQLATNRVPGTTNSFQLMLNSYKVLLGLAQPFIRLGSSFSSAELLKQLAKVNRDYFAYAASYDISSETKVLAAENAPFNAQNFDKPLNFVTECFFLTAGYLQFGFHAAVQAMTGSLKHRLDHFEAQLTSFDTDPNIQALLPPMRQLTRKRFEALVVDLKCELAGVTALLHHPEFMGQTIRFAEFTLAFSMYAAENGPSQLEVRVPWDVAPPENYESYPEFMLDGPIVSASFVMRTSEFLRDPSISGSNDELLFDTAIFFMSSPVVLRNPYLRSKFVEVLFFGGVDVPLTNGSHIPGPLSTLFLSSETCRKFLLPALMSVFIDIEHTGRNAQFYEKFTTREFVANVLKVLWRDPHYRDQLVTESRSQPDFFVKFVALLLDDATYLLDEALGKLLKLNQLENAENERIMAGPAAGGPSAAGGAPAPAPANANRSDAQGSGGAGEANGEANGDANGEENDEDEEGEADPATQIRSAERSAKNFLDLSKSTVTLLNTFTSTVPSIFATPEIIDRFAVMLNYNLAALVGPRCRELKVRNAAAVGFHPRELLTDIIRVYLNLRREAPFPKAIAKDERSYRDETMRKAQQILTKFNLLSPVDLDHFSELTTATREAWFEAQAEEEEFGDDVPDEFLDPLMYTLMENPVILPTSRVSIDLSTIKTHLLSDPTDPFNRVPLKIEDVLPNDGLKREIEAFKREKKAKSRDAEMKDY